MAVKWAISSGNWSNAANWNGGTKPVAGDDVYANTFTLNVDENINVASLNNTATTGVTAGGTFNFNTAGVTASITGVTPISQGASTAVISVTNTTGSVIINVSNNITVAGNAGWTNILYSGNGDLNFTCPNINIITLNNGLNAYLINKSGSGTLTFNGNLQILHQTTGNTLAYTLLVSAGNVIVNGNLQPSYTSTQGGTARIISQTSGNLTINGNVFLLPFAYIAAHQTINFSGTLLTINGNIISNVGNGISSTGAIVVNGNVGGAYNANAYGISTSNNVTVIGNVYSGAGGTITSTSAISVTVTGDVYASYLQTGIYLTNGSSVVNLTGNMYNVNGVQAIFAPTILVSPSATTRWTLQQLGVVDKVFYSSDTTPGNPIAANVRNGVAYGPGLGTTGTMIVPAASDVRMGVAVDNTTGTGELTAADFLAAIQVSTDPSAERLKNVLTVDSIGNTIQNYNT